MRKIVPADTATLRTLMELPLSAGDKHAWQSAVYTSSTLMRHPVKARLNLVRDGATDTVHLILTVPGQIIMPSVGMMMETEDVMVWAGMDDPDSVQFHRDYRKEEVLSGFKQRNGLAVAAGPMPLQLPGNLKRND